MMSIRSAVSGRRALAVAALVAVTASAQAENWPSFRGLNASGIGEGTAPTTWKVATSLHIKWKTPIPGLGHSSPVVWKDRVFVTTAITSAPKLEFITGLSGDLRSAEDVTPQSWRVYCLDKRTGRVLWEKVLHEGVPRSKRHLRNSYATPTPVTDGKHLIVSLGSEGLYGLDLDGNVRWTQNIGLMNVGFYADTRLQWGVGSSPILYGNLVIIQADLDQDSFLAAYDVESGKQVWKVAREERQSWSTPTVYQGAPHDELVTLAPLHARGYDPKTGQELWKLGWGMDIIQSTPVVGGGLIYFSSGKGSQQPIIALRPGASGDLTLPPGRPVDPHIAWSKDRWGPITTSPLLYGDHFYALTDQGVLRCLDAKTGELIYTQRLPDEFLASPVAADGKLYLTSENGDVYVVRAGPKYELLAMNSMDEVCLATPAISDGTLIVRTQHLLLGIEESPIPPARSATESRPHAGGAHGVRR
jgi:outer membrane protein assembly factor BamB